MKQNEVLEKEYFNIELENKLQRIVSREKYGDFAIIIREIFQRRAYEFEFSEKEIIQQAINFEKNVEKVQFLPSSNFSSESTMGVYRGREKSISINQDYYLNAERYTNEQVLGDKMFETLTHEVYHAINDLSGNVLGLTYYDSQNGKWVGTALNEIMTETAADRACYGRNSRDADRYRRDTDGYGSITFATNLLAAGLGTSEKELLKAGIQHRGKLEQLIFSKFPKDINFGVYARDSYLAAFEQSLNTVYNIDYNHNLDHKETPEEFKMRKNLLKGALIGLYEQSYRLANFQISVSPNDVDKEFTAESLYRFSKLEKITEDSLNEFAIRYGFSDQDKSDIFMAILHPRMDLGTKVVGMNMLQKQGHKIKSPEELELQKSLAKRGLIFEGNNIKMLNQVYNVELPKMIGIQEAREITSDLEYISYMMKEDFDDGRRWDDGTAGIVTRKIFIEDMVKKGKKFRVNSDFLQDTEELPIVDDLDKTEELPIVDDPDKTEELPIVDDPDKTEEIPIVDDPDKTEEIPIIDDPDKTEEIPIVDDPDKTEELPIIDDLDKTEPLPVVNLENVQAVVKDNNLKNEDKQESTNFISNITNKLKGLFNRIKNRNQKQLPAAQEENKVEDKSAYYAGLVSTANEYQRKEPTFDERYRVAPEDLKPLKTTKDNNERTKDDDELTMD